jgi:hypothetical protein
MYEKPEIEDLGTVLSLTKSEFKCSSGVGLFTFLPVDDHLFKITDCDGNTFFVSN